MCHDQVTWDHVWKFNKRKEMELYVHTLWANLVTYYDYIIGYNELSES